MVTTASQGLKKSQAGRGRLAGAAALALLLGLVPAPAALAQATPPAATKPAAAAVDPRWVWDLSPIFKSPADWDAARKSLQAMLPKLAKLQGTLGKDAAGLRTALETINEANRLLERVSVYAYIDSTTDQRDPTRQERRNLAGVAQSEVSAAVAWLAPEIQAIGKEKIESFIAADKGLAVYAFGLRDTLRQKDHTLTAETEAALAALGPVLGSSNDVYGLLKDADIAWPSLKLPDGSEVKLNDTGYTRNRQHPDRATRKQVFDTFWPVYGQFADSMGATLGATVQAGVIQAKLRRYPSAVAASLSANNIPESVYRTLVAEANKGLPTLHRYFKLRQKLLKLPDLGYYDIYPAMVKSDRKFPAAESVSLTLAATTPLGADYVSRLKVLTETKRTHAYPADGKQSGAYQWGVYGVEPYVFLNHQDDYNSMSTLAHEWGHGMHTDLANRTQPFQTAGYSLFMAEIASTANEFLLSDYMLSKATTRDERLFYLGEALEGLRGTFFRQTMFAEFELATHDAVERGEAISGTKMTEIYCDLLKRYHGADKGVMAINDAYCAEWSYIPHFYRPFYVYQYATSIAAAAFFTEQIQKGGDKARDTYLGVLKAGGSQYPYDLLKGAGLDMASPAPYQALIRRMDSIMDEMEKLLAQKG
jgi:oligoendopeptidase F